MSTTIEDAVPVILEATIRVPLWQHEVEEFSADLQHELALLLSHFGGVRRGINVEMTVDLAGEGQPS